MVRVRVRGEFPNQEDDVFIALSIIEQCGSRLFELDDGKLLPYIIFGVDVARFGDDENDYLPQCQREIENRSKAKRSRI